MRKKINIALILAAVAIFALPETTFTQSKDVKVELTVLGNCGMCKERIERAAYGIRGVRIADWNKNDQKLTLTYRSDRTDQASIEKAIAKAGHDTENYLADEETYKNLHHCCVYKRNPEFLSKNKVWNQ